MKTAIIIPARIGSTRLPNKPLAMINGKTLIQHCFESAISSNCGDVFVATDSLEIAGIIKAIGGNVLVTPSDLPSGTDRIHNAYKQIGVEYELIVNLQGDIPNIATSIIQDVIQTAIETNCDISTAVMKIDPQTAQKPSCVKAVLTPSGKHYKALYFSRSAIPHNAPHFFEHIGIYVYKAQSLQKFVSLVPSTLEEIEKLEQLRALENNMSIYACIVDSSLKPISIDTQADLDHAIKTLQKKEFKSTQKYKELAQSLKQNLLRRKTSKNI